MNNVMRWLVSEVQTHFVLGLEGHSVTESADEVASRGRENSAAAELFVTKSLTAHHPV